MEWHCTVVSSVCVSSKYASKRRGYGAAGSLVYVSRTPPPEKVRVHTLIDFVPSRWVRATQARRDSASKPQKYILYTWYVVNAPSSNVVVDVDALSTRVCLAVSIPNAVEQNTPHHDIKNNHSLPPS